MNINDSIWKAAEKLGLSWIATGGGCDFIHTERDGWELILGAAEDVGCSPDTLSEESVVSVYPPGSQWMTGIFFKFPTASKAMKFMANQIDYTTVDPYDYPDMMEFMRKNRITEEESRAMQGIVMMMRSKDDAPKSISKQVIKEFSVNWSKCYFSSGTEKIKARSEEEARKIMERRIGDMSGTMQYDPDRDYIEVYPA